MKIAIICSSFFPVIDGVTIAIFNRVKQLSSLGHQVLLFCPDYSEIAYIYPDWQDYTGELFPGIKIINLPSSKSIALEFERDVTIKSYTIVIQELEKFQPDLIHIDEAERLSFCFLRRPGIKFARQHDIPCLAWFHTNYIDYFDDYFSLPFKLNKLVKYGLSKMFTRIYNTCTCTLVSSNFTWHKLAKKGIDNLQYAELLGYDSHNFNQIHRDNQFLVNQYKLPSLANKIKLIFLGRLTPDKGWHFTLESLAKLSPKILNQIAIIIVGEGTLKTVIEQSLSTLITDVYFLGRVSPQSVPELLINSDIFITNSEKETRGLTLIEAAAAGIPAIAPRAGGVIDTICDGETGYLYQPQNSDDFLAKLELLIANQTLRESMGKKAKSIASQWTWEQTTNNLIEIWSQAILNKNQNSYNQNNK